MRDLFITISIITIFSANGSWANSLNYRLQQFSGKTFSAPAGELYCQKNPDGVTVIPNGRLVRPTGKQLLLEPHPYGLTVSADGQLAVTANSGTEPFSFSIIRNPFSDNPSVQDIPEGVKTDAGVLNACFMGLATAPPPNSHILYAAGGEDGTVMVWDLDQKERVRTIELNVPFNGRNWNDGYTGDLVLSPDGKRLYVVDQMNFRVVAVDVETGQIIDVIPVGRYPFGLAITPDGKKLFVANIGLFEYSAVDGFDPNNFRETSLSFPATKYLSDEMKEGTDAEGVHVPGLGDPNVDEAVSVYVVDLDDAGKGTVTKKIKTGVLVGEKVEDIPALGGASPNSLVTDGRFVYVTNGTNDSISVIDVESGFIVDEIRILMPKPFHILRGVIPFGLALSKDGSRLYVAESGINAVGVIDANARRVLGHIPVGWFPSKLKLSPDGKQLIVANAKGFGAGPNGGPGVDLEGRSGIGNLMRGTASIFTIPPEEELAFYTQQTIDNNVRIDSERWGKVGDKNPVPPYPGAYQSPIEYTVFIVKENRTYDQVYGELEGGKGEPSIVDFGLDMTVRSIRRKDDVVEHVNVMPNHQILARRFAACDNFHCDSDHSADGHRWLQGVYPGVWTETGTTASYGGRRRGNVLSTAPGRRAVTGS
ncbi:hypothetical protein K8I31_06160, partial [bacterium]|nr:hypothetical protein [bacterium]